MAHWKRDSQHMGLNRCIQGGGPNGPQGPMSTISMLPNMPARLADYHGTIRWLLGRDFSKVVLARTMQA